MSQKNEFTTDDLRDATRPIQSLITKSEKAKSKLAPGTWQYTMLDANLNALRVALLLMGSRSNDVAAFTREELQAALHAFGAMTIRSRNAQAKFEPGTSQHTLQLNRLNAFRTAEILIADRLK